MSEPTPSSPPTAMTAGAMLREARERQGMHIAALAASIKVTPRKLDALENDRYDELPDLTFARALAQTVCRSLKIDAAPVLAALPQKAPSSRLEEVATGINTPFRDRPGRHEPTEGSVLNRPAFWAPTILLLCAVILYLMPADALRGLVPDDGAASAPAAAASEAQPVASAPADPAAAPDPAATADGASAPGLVSSAAQVTVETVHSAPSPATDLAATVAPAQPAASALGLRATAESWVEVRDAGGQVLLSRALQAGESVTVEGALPLRATIGNAAATTVTFRGQPLDLASSTRDNIARIELK